MNKGGGDGRGGGGKSSGAGKGSNPSDGKSEKKKKWYNSNPENLTTKEHNGKTYYWCMNCNYGRGKWVTHKKRFVRIGASKVRRNLVPMIRTMLVMDLAESGFLVIELL